MQHRIPSECFFAILFEGRTGSSYTVSALNNHPHVLCYPEIVSSSGVEMEKPVLEALIRGHPVERIFPGSVRKHFFENDPNDKHDLRAVGLKIQLHLISEIVHFYTTLRRHRFKLIYLKRKNILKSVVSYLNAKRLLRNHGMGHNAFSPDQVQGAIHIPPGLFVNELQRRTRNEIWHEEFFAAYDLDKRILYYEDLLNDWDTFWADLLAYLGVDWMPGRGRYFKNTPDRLSDAIRNYQQIREWFAGTVFEPFFDE